MEKLRRGLWVELMDAVPQDCLGRVSTSQNASLHIEQSPGMMAMSVWLRHNDPFKLLLLLFLDFVLQRKVSLVAGESIRAFV